MMTTTIQESPTYALHAATRSRLRGSAAGLRRFTRSVPWPICLITAIAAALRFVEIDGVGANQFYDAAVRSMSMSWHNFFFGAFDPGGLLSIDKPPLDLWLQVASVKLLGWNQFALKFPEALGGTLCVPLLYDAVRRAVGQPAGLAAAIALAVLPESVLTSRSDTMDSVMMLLVIAALWLTIRACRSDGRRSIALAGVALGLAFNVKLMEAFVAVPALIALYLLAGTASRRRKLADLCVGGMALVAVGLAWAIPVSLAPGRHPWPVGSSDGTVWNAMFVFNGFGRVSSSPGTSPGGPGPFRLIVSTAWHYDLLLGCVLVAAVAIGGAAALRALRRSDNGHPAEYGGRAEDRRVARAFAVALAVWIAFAVVVFDSVGTVHVRYLEALAPALAAAIGYGAATLAGLRAGRGRGQVPSVAMTTAALALICAYTFGLKPQAIAGGVAALMIVGSGAALIARARGRLGAVGSRWLVAGLIVACALAFPVYETVSVVRSNANDSLGLATAPGDNAAALSSYLQPRTAGIRYELAVDEPLALAPLLIHDQRPIIPLTSFGGIALTGLRQLLQDVRAGAVSYGLVAHYKCGPQNTRWAGCGPAALWIRHHGIDVTSAVGLVGPSRLYQLSPSRAG